MKDIKDRIIEAHEDFEVLLNPYIEDIYKLMNKHDVGIAKSYLRELLDLKSQLSEQDDICVCKEDYDVEIISMEPPVSKCTHCGKYIYFSPNEQDHITIKDLQAIDQAREQNNV